MTNRVTVLCPGCGGDWRLERPRAADLVTEVWCECGTAFTLSIDGGLTAVMPEGRPAAPERADAGARPRAIGALVAEILPELERRRRA